jgi:hypothetical protein
MGAMGLGAAGDGHATGPSRGGMGAGGGWAGSRGIFWGYFGWGWNGLARRGGGAGHVRPRGARGSSVASRDQRETGVPNRVRAWESGMGKGNRSTRSCGRRKRLRSSCLRIGSFLCFPELIA